MIMFPCDVDLERRYGFRRYPMYLPNELGLHARGPCIRFPGDDISGLVNPTFHLIYVIRWRSRPAAIKE